MPVWLAVGIVLSVDWRVCRVCKAACTRPWLAAGDNVQGRPPRLGAPPPLPGYSSPPMKEREQLPCTCNRPQRALRAHAPAWPAKPQTLSVHKACELRPADSRLTAGTLLTSGAAPHTKALGPPGRAAAPCPAPARSPSSSPALGVVAAVRGPAPGARSRAAAARRGRGTMSRGPRMRCQERRTLRSRGPRGCRRLLSSCMGCGRRSGGIGTALSVAG